MIRKTTFITLSVLQFIIVITFNSDINPSSPIPPSPINPISAEFVHTCIFKKIGIVPYYFPSGAENLIREKS